MGDVDVVQQSISMEKKLHKQVKICPVCLRPFTNRKKWDSRNVWDRIIYCSDRCRNRSKKI